MKRRGFTIVELIITIAVMGILLTLAVISLRSSETNGRDAERKADAEAIASRLEDFYNTTDQNIGAAGGVYPDTAHIDEDSLRLFAPDISAGMLRAPGVDTDEAASLVPATNASTPPNLMPTPGESADRYVYQPFTATKTLCTNAGVTPCVRFVLYYYQETTGAVEVIDSRHQ